MKGFWPVRSSAKSWKIAKDVTGPLPKELQSEYTSEKDAQKAIDLFQQGVRNRAKPRKINRNKAKEIING